MYTSLIEFTTITTSQCNSRLKPDLRLKKTHRWCIFFRNSSHDRWGWICSQGSLPPSKMTQKQGTGRNNGEGLTLTQREPHTGLWGEVIDARAGQPRGLGSAPESGWLNVGEPVWTVCSSSSNKAQRSNYWQSGTISQPCWEAGKHLQQQNDPTLCDRPDAGSSEPNVWGQEERKEESLVMKTCKITSSGLYGRVKSNTFREEQRLKDNLSLTVGSFPVYGSINQTNAESWLRLVCTHQTKN